MNWYLTALDKYGVLAGRSRRREFWWFHVFDFLFFFILSTVEEAGRGVEIASSGDTSLYLFSTVYAVLTLLPSVAVTIRRLHDVGCSGFWVFLGVIPVLGWILLLIFFVRDSDYGRNKYGPSPKM